MAGPLLLLKTAVAKGKKGTSTAPSQELLTSLKDFKKAHGALKTKASMGDPSKGFYNSHAVKDVLEKKYPGKIMSSTVPNPKSKNVSLAGQRHPSTGIVFDNKGFPIFDDIAKFDTRISREIAHIDDPIKHMKIATRQLKEAIFSGTVSKQNFTKYQLRDINLGKPKISDLTWHHHQDVGRMQLIPETLHLGTGHVGGMSLWPLKK